MREIKHLWLTMILVLASILLLLFDWSELAILTSGIAGGIYVSWILFNVWEPQE